MSNFKYILIYKGGVAEYCNAALSNEDYWLVSDGILETIIDIEHGKQIRLSESGEIIESEIKESKR